VSIETLLLLVDELTEAVLERAGTEHGLMLALSAHDAQGVRVTLADGSAVRATAEDVVRGAPTLSALLESLTARWGDEPYEGGYSIWFELAPEEPDPTLGELLSDEPEVAVRLGEWLAGDEGH
jgi:hypothetical protein